MGDAREDSDVDVLVDVDPSIGLKFVQLADEIERAFGRRADVVSRRAIGPAFWKHSSMICGIRVQKSSSFGAASVP